MTLICPGNGDPEYSIVMHNWDYDLTAMQAGPEAERWMLERMILYGLDGRRIPLELLRKHWAYLQGRTTIPPERLHFLNLFL
ncbi:hypothetical protein HY213_03940 [Candidatus Peregrinibacteria bacterium]|nr:hypothetical protein [Candidatus Peregrinibacteria bacterium]